MSVKSPQISVVMSVYNGAHFLREAIDSILSQTFREFEFIIIDDGSTDSSAEIICEYKDERIKYVKQENAGLAAALNKGIKLANGDYIARMDADDFSFPYRLSMQREFLDDHPSIIAVGAAAEWIDKSGEYICTLYTPQTPEEILETLPHTPFVHPSVMFRKSAWREVGGYPERFRWGGQDAVLFNKMSKVGELANIPQPLIKYRITPNASTRMTKRQKYFLNSLIYKAINNIAIQDEEFLLLMQECRSTSKEMKEYIYYLTIAEKLLWGNPCPVKAREKLRSAIKSSPWELRPWLLYALSFFPSAFIRSVHNFVKRNIVGSENKDVFR